ncbi:hypothetical protein FRC08_003137 [Ceratobasidium sp. 394]|nr:hypothetical protein FRC08_003137 [Ceratobasidium sp. 394]KAG9101790.1 hypothetical protein FS749_003093 [Ceratobasidium sp. UAMH 11750]
MINRDWFLDISVFDHNARRTVMFVLKVQAPDNNHFKKISTVRAGSMVFVRDLLGYIAIKEDSMTQIVLEAVMFLSKVGNLPALSKAICFDDLLTEGGFLEKSFSKHQLHEVTLSTSGSPLKSPNMGHLKPLLTKNLAASLPPRPQSLPWYLSPLWNSSMYFLLV